MNFYKISILLFIALIALPLSSQTTEREMGPRPNLDEEKISEWIVTFTNDERKKAGLHPLKAVKVLNLAAKLQSDYLTKTKALSHNQPALRDPHDRVREACKTMPKGCFKQFVPDMKEAGKRYITCCGENIIESFAGNYAGVPFYSRTDEKGKYKEYVSDVQWFDEKQLAKEMVDRWMKSPGHKANIMHKEYQAIGVWVSFDKDERYFGTQVFAPYNDGD